MLALLAASCNSNVSPTASPSSVPSASSAPSATAAATAVATSSSAPSLPASLPAGTYTSQIMRPRVTLTVPDGLLTESETTDHLLLTASVDPTNSEIFIARAAGTGLIDGLLGRPGLVVGIPVAATVGGVAGRAVDIGLAAGVTGPIFLFDGADAVVGQPDTWGMTTGFQEHLIELKVGGSTIVIAYVAKTAAYPAFQKTADPIVSSIQFGSP